MKLKTILKAALLLGAVVEFFITLYAGIADAPMVIMRSVLPWAIYMATAAITLLVVTA